MKKKKQSDFISENKKARRDFFIQSYYESGLVLLGTEVKSLRMGKASLKDSYVQVINGEGYVKNLKISKYPFANYNNHEPDRVKKILLHKYEIKKIQGKVLEKGYTLVPIKIFFKKGKVKMLIGLAKGKRLYDKRDTIRRRDQERDLRRELKKYK